MQNPSQISAELDTQNEERAHNLVRRFNLFAFFWASAFGTRFNLRLGDRNDWVLAVCVVGVKDSITPKAAP